MWGASLPKILGGAETSVPKMGMLDMDYPKMGFGDGCPKNEVLETNFGFFGGGLHYHVSQNVRGQAKCVGNYF